MNSFSKELKIHEFKNEKASLVREVAERSSDGGFWACHCEEVAEQPTRQSKQHVIARANEARTSQSPNNECRKARNDKRNVILNLIQDLSMPVNIDRFRVEHGMTKRKAAFTLAEVKRMFPRLGRGSNSKTLTFPSPTAFFGRRGSGCSSVSELQPRVRLGERGYKAAFTMAEVLITLAIVGVVSAITLPILVTNIQERVRAEQVRTAKYKLTLATDKMKSMGL